MTIRFENVGIAVRDIGRWTRPDPSESPSSLEWDCLPWSVAGQVMPDTEGGVTQAERLVLLAQALIVGESDRSAADERPNSLYSTAHEWAETVGLLITFAQTREPIEVRSRPADDLDLLSFSTRSRRNRGP